MIPICLSLSTVAELIERRIHKQKFGVRIPEVSESEKLSEHKRMVNKDVGKKNGGWSRAEKALDLFEFEKDEERKMVED